MNCLRKKFYKNKELISYIFFGALTTIINIITYLYFYEVINLNNTISNIAAWVASVLFAFITNKFFVFNSPSFKLKIFIRELVAFFIFRFGTGVIDIIIMIVSVDLLVLNPLVIKTVSNVIVIILNYVGSKLIVFRNKK